MKLSLKVVPGASRSGIVGWLGDSLKVGVTTPAESGKANAAVKELLSKALSIPKTAIEIVSVRYYGAYSSRSRGEHKSETTPAVVAGEDRTISQAARAAWAKLIYRVYEADPLICPRCGNTMRVIAVINETAVIRRILQHLKLWNPRPTERGPPPQSPAPDWPVLVLEMK